MRRRFAISLALSLVSCTSTLERRLDRIDQRLAAIERPAATCPAPAAASDGALDQQTPAVVLAALAERLAALDENVDEIRRSLQAPAAGLGGGAWPSAGQGGGAAGGGAAPAAHGHPDPAEVYAVAIDGYPTDGKASAKVTLVEFYEYACPYCRKAEDTVDDLEKKYGGDLRVVRRQFIVHPIATDAAQASCAADLQGKFRAMHHALWTEGFDKNRDLGADAIERFAGEVGLDLTRFRADEQGVCAQKLKDGLAEATALGVSGTPSFFINGRSLVGAQPADRFEAVIDEELKKADDKIGKQGTTAKNYYRKWVLEKGRKQVDP